jgi:Fe-S-cluster containining protein
MAWACQSSGACCTHPPYVVMTYAERRELERLAGTRRLRWRYHPHPRFTALVAGPCPFLTGENKCGAYEARPFNCRRFGCLRPDVNAEAWDGHALTDEDRSTLAAMQAESQPWALAHGWKETDRDA